MANIFNSLFAKNDASRAITKIDPSLKRSDQRKMRAAMALNMCTASVSEIIAKNNVIAMEREYDNILNNLNIESCVKDEALLKVMRKLLDAISFFRLNDMERKRLEKRRERHMGGTMLEKMLSAGPSIFIAGTMNPMALATTAAVVGASMYANKKKEDGKEQEKFEDKMWELERSAIEQLHALRVELFETAWRLSDAYEFKDEWRLSEKQIEWYNETRSEYDPFLRFKKLDQRRADFSVYPHFWYELGCAALEITQKPVKAAGNVPVTASKGSPDKPIKGSAVAGDLEAEDPVINNPMDGYRNEAKACFQKFIEQDPHLLRQDFFAADARLKFISIVKDELGSWSNAVLQDGDKIANVHKLAMDNVELMLKAAMVYASAYIELIDIPEEARTDAQRESLVDWYKKATSILEQLVLRDSALPVSSVVLSGLYKKCQDRIAYDKLVEIKRLTRNEKILLLDYETPPEKEKETLKDLLSQDDGKSIVSTKTLISRTFGMILQLADPAFNVTEDEQRKVLQKWAIETNDFKNGIQQFWEVLKGEFNTFFIFVGREFASVSGSDEKLVEIARRLNDTFTKQLMGDMKDKNPDEKAAAVVCILDAIRREFKELMGQFVDSCTTTDLSDNSTGVYAEDFRGALSFYIDSICMRKNIVGISKDSRSFDACRRNYFDGLEGYVREDEESNDEYEPSLFGFDREFLENGRPIEYSKIDHADFIERLIKNKLTYTITFETVKSRNAKCTLVESVRNLLEDKYRNEKVSIRDLRSRKSCGGFWRKLANVTTKIGKKMYNITGANDYIISIYDEWIEVVYQRMCTEECLMPIGSLSSQALERECKRLMNADCQPGTHEYKRLSDAYVRTMDMEFAQMIAEFNEAKSSLNDKQQKKERDKLIKRFKKATIKFMKLGNSKHLWAAQNNMGCILNDVKQQKLRILLFADDVLGCEGVTDVCAQLRLNVQDPATDASEKGEMSSVVNGN